MLHEGSSLQEHLAISIRRAKQKIFNNAMSFSNSSLEILQDQQQAKQTFSSQMDSRIRSISTTQKMVSNQSKQEKSALAAAMKILQQKIAVLQNQNKDLKNQFQSVLLSEQTGKSDENLKELYKIREILREKENQVNRLDRINKDLEKTRNIQIQRISFLENQLKTIQIQKRTEYKDNKIHNTYAQTTLKQIIEKNELKVRQLTQQNKQSNEAIRVLTESNLELQQRNTLNHGIIQKLTNQLQNQRKTNLRWIKLHDDRLNDHKENMSMQANVDRNLPKKQTNKHSKESHQIIEKNNAKLASITKKCKQYQQKYRKTKMIAQQIIEVVNKTVINPNSHIRFLTLKLHRLENNHPQSQQNYSNYRKSRLNENSGSKQKKRKSLKMSDLNSNSKKQRSVSGSRRKTKILQDSIIKSQKKRQNNEKISQVYVLERQINELNKKYINMVARASSDRQHQKQQISQLSQLIFLKKQKLQQLINENRL